MQDYDYSQAGAYFITICTRNRELLFEESSVHQIAKECWLALPDHFPSAALDEWVIMPNHLHGILVIGEGGTGRDVERGHDRRGVQLNAPTPMNAPTRRDLNSPHSVISPQRDTLAVIVRTYKSAVTTRCRRAGYEDFGWQRNYYEHIVRDESDLDRIRQYIYDNPLHWELDEYYPARESSRVR